MSNSVPNFKRRGFLRRAAGAAVTMALGASLLTACAAGGDTSPAPASSGDPVVAQDAPLVPLTFLSFLPLTSFTVAPEMLGDLTGDFENNGLDIELQEVKGSAQATQLLLANKGQVARNGLIDAMLAAFQENQPVKVVGVDTYSTGIRIVTSDASPNPADWVGKTIGVPSVGGTSDKTLSMSLIEAGIDPDSVERQLVGLSAGTFEMVQNGTLAGYAVSSDTALIVAKQNPDARIFTPTTATGINIYMSTEEQIEKNGDALRSFFRSINQTKSALISAANYDEQIKMLRSKYSFAALDDDEIAQAAFEDRSKAWTNPSGGISEPDMVEIEKAYQELVKAGFVPGGKNIEDLIDTSLFSN